MKHSSTLNMCFVVNPPLKCIQTGVHSVPVEKQQKLKWLIFPLFFAGSLLHKIYLVNI